MVRNEADKHYFFMQFASNEVRGKDRNEDFKICFG
jgi:hypothetical protein